MAAYPASDPLVTAVGGTQGRPYPDGLWRSPGGYGGESTWNEGEVYDLATGGAPSIFFPAPFWQRAAGGGRARSVPDVAYNAAVDGGVLVYNAGHVYTVGGTSAGPPQWSAIFALAGELRARAHRPPLGFATDNLYRLARSGSSRADFHDVTDGDNRLDSDIGFAARPRLRRPDRARLARRLAPARRPRRSAAGPAGLRRPRPVDRGAAAADPRPAQPPAPRASGELSRQYATAPLPVAAAWRCSSAR